MYGFTVYRETKDGEEFKSDYDEYLTDETGISSRKADHSYHLDNIIESKKFVVNKRIAAEDNFDNPHDERNTVEDTFNIIYDNLNAIVIDTTKPNPKAPCCNFRKLKIHVRLRRDAMKGRPCSCVKDLEMKRWMKFFYP